MRDILAKYPEAVQEAGLRLIALGAELLAGRIDDAIARVQAEGQKYPEWVALDNAAVTINAAVRERAQGEDIRDALTRTDAATPSTTASPYWGDADFLSLTNRQLRESSYPLIVMAWGESYHYFVTK